jgi:biopolymer transport protein ExbB
MKVIVAVTILLCSVLFSSGQEPVGRDLRPRGPEQVSVPNSDRERFFESGEQGLRLSDVLRKGGWAMVPLGGLSIVAGMLVLGCLVTLRRGAIVSRQYVSTVEVLIRKRDYLGVLAVSNRHGEALARIVQKTLDFATKNPGAPFESLREVAEAEGSAQASSLVHRVAYLADIGILAPMVGLFGTVIGIIRSFGEIGKGNASLSRDVLLASGVSEALVATAAGLVLAIIAAGFYAVFRNRAQALVSELEGASSTFVGLMAIGYHKRAEASRGDDEF